jgi:dTDP-4-dehydrorhamnose 3,5-epimerase
MRPKPVLVVGASGQLGRSLSRRGPRAVGIGRHQLDLSRPEVVAEFDLSPYGVVVNAARTPRSTAPRAAPGRREAWTVNVAGVGALVRAAREAPLHPGAHLLRLRLRRPGTPSHDEDEPFSPVGVYGQTKAAGDALVATWARHYVPADQLGDRGRPQLRPDHGPGWPSAGVSPSVVDDQHGRLTFTAELARAIGTCWRPAHRSGPTT